MARHCRYSIEFKRRATQEFLGGETLYGLARRHDVSRNLTGELHPVHSLALDAHHQVQLRRRGCGVRACARIALRQHAVQLDHGRIGHHDIGKLPQHAAVRRLVLRDPLAQLPHDTSKQSHQPRRESVVERRGHHRHAGRSLVHPTKTGQGPFAPAPIRVRLRV